MDIHYRFVASGHADVEKAFAGIEARAKASKKATDDAMRSGRGGGSASAGGGGAGGRPRLTETERLAQRVAASQERAAAREIKVAERAANAKAKAEERARRHVASIRDKHFADEQRLGERAEKDRVRRAERGAREAARKETAARERAQRESESKRSQSIGVLKDLAGGAFLGAVGTGTALIGSAAKEALSLHEAANRISINSRKSGEGFRSADELRRGFERTAIATPGQSAAGIADAVARFVSLTGDVDTALKSQDTFATVASATGANVGDVAEAAASLSQQFDIKGIEEMRDALAALTFQGKEGSFELKDAAAQFQRLAASGAAFGIPKGVSGVKTLGGLTQIARSGTGSAEQAATAVENLLTNLKLKQTQLKSAGVSVFDASGKTRNVTDVVMESISKVGGNDMAAKSKGLAQIFGEQGIRAINPLIAKYQAAFTGAEGKGGKKATDADRVAAGMAALRAEIEHSINAPGDWAEVQEDAAQAQQDASARITSAWETIKAKTADSLLPTIEGLATKLAESPEVLDPFIEGIAIAGGALEELADVLRKFGIGKEPTKAEKLAKAQKALDRFDAKHTGVGPLTAEDQAQRDKLADAVKAADDALWGKAMPPGASPDGLDYLGAKPPSEGFYDAIAAQARGTTGTFLQGMGAMGMAPDNDLVMKYLGGETDAQADVRHQRSAKEKADEMAAAQPITTDEIQNALNAAAQAAKDAAAALQKMSAAGQGSIVTGV